MINNCLTVYCRWYCQHSSWRRDLYWRCLQTAWPTQTTSYGK